MFRNFKLNIFFRILLIFTLLLSWGYCWQVGPLYVECFILLIIIGVAFYNLFHYLDQGHQAVSSFLQGIQYNDFTLNFPTHSQGSSLTELYESFNLVNRKFQELSAAKAAHGHYLNTIVEHVNIGLVCFDQNQKVILFNQALKKILQKPYLIDLAAFRQLDVQLFQVIQSLRDREKALVKIVVDHQLVALAIEANEFILQGKAYRLLSFQNIQSELEQEELVAWQKLLRTLRHEIMNSITPITTLAATLDEQLLHVSQNPTQVVEEDWQDMQAAIRAIRKRSEGLFRFTDSYHHLNGIQKANFKMIALQTLLQRIQLLFQAIMDHKKINFECKMPQQTLSALIDADLLEQAIINLLKNAIDAVEEVPSPKIQLNLQRRVADNSIQLQIKDNGVGMDQASRAQIFIPFYTTKKEGTGIGLNLCRQIVQLHKGRLELQSEAGQGSIFTISL